ncbi:MAG: hypothetical protein WEC12_07480 [Balneolaceae bacterium]
MSLLLTLGTVVHTALPTSGKAQKAAFAQWLDRNVVEDGAEHASDIRAHIKKLPFQHENFVLLLKEATMLIANHENGFKLPTAHNVKDTGSISLWLVGKWSQHQSDSGMDALVETYKPALAWFVQHSSFPGILSAGSPDPAPLLPGALKNVLFVIQSQPIPFLSGISINAP